MKALCIIALAALFMYYIKPVRSDFINDPTIDGSSDEAFMESLVEVKKGLSQDENKLFDLAVSSHITTPVNAAILGAMPPEKKVETVSAMMRLEFDGMTAKEIIERAKTH